MFLNKVKSAQQEKGVDVIIVSNRGTKMITNLFLEAAAHADIWQKHHFIVLYDHDHEYQALRTWVNEHQDTLNLPKITVCRAARGNERNVSALRQQGIQQGENPYIYFQDDDDPLPTGIEQRIEILENSDLLAVYGVAKKITQRGQVIEQFPQTSIHGFMYEPVQAARLFPTYAHPLAALFKRELFNMVPMYDHKNYLSTGSYSFGVRLFTSGLPIQFLSDTIRVIRHHESDNHNGILEKCRSESIAKDILTWAEHIKDPEIKEFQQHVAQDLLNGHISTYREINAQVESKLDGILL